MSTPVTISAIIARIKRKYKPDFIALKKSRGARVEATLGEYYTVDLRRNAILDTHVDPATEARELGVLHQWEYAEA